MARTRTKQCGAGGDRRFGRREVGGGWRWDNHSERCVPLGPSDSVTSSHRAVRYRLVGVPRSLPHQPPGFKQESSHLASPPTSHPSPPSLPPVAAAAACAAPPLPPTLPRLLCRARAPFRAGIGNPESPTLARREGTNNRIDDAELPSARRRHRLRDQPRPRYLSRPIDSYPLDDL